VTIISANWKNATLGDICTLKYGKALPQSTRSGGNFSVYGSNGVVGYHDAAITSGRTIVIGRKGSYGEVNFSAEPCWPIDTAYFVDETSTEQDIKWLAYRLADLGLNQLNKAAAVPGLNREDAYRQPLLVPPLPEQRRIAAILDQADALRAKRREAMAQLDSLTQSIFIEMFGDPATNPKSWPIRKIEQLCEVKGGKRLPKGAEYSASPTPFRYVRVTNIEGGKIDVSKLLYLTPEVQRTIARYIVNTGDVIISIAGSIGLVAAVPQSLNGANLTENAAKLVAHTKNLYLPDFLAFVLSMKAIQSQIESHVGKVTIGKLALFRIEKLLIPLPPLPLQQTFFNRTQSVEVLKVAHRKAICELDYLFASLQHRAFQGEL
jgi:type I restriction enzyme S subunit